MTAQVQKLCDRCHERPATCHICYGHSGETKDLCEACYEQSASPVEAGFKKRKEELIRTGSCQYCGAPAKIGTFGFSAIFGEEVKLWCEQCRRDLAEFALRPENALPEDIPFDDEAALERLSQQFAEREHRQKEFMKQRILERRSKDDD